METETDYTPFINNKYTDLYFKIIEKSKNRIINDYVEVHHIIPDCFYIKRSRKGQKGCLHGDPNNRINLVKLQAREHYICHWLLTKMVPNGPMYYKMELAFGKLKQKGIGQKRN